MFGRVWLIPNASGGVWMIAVVFGYVCPLGLLLDCLCFFLYTVYQQYRKTIGEIGCCESRMSEQKH